MPHQWRTLTLEVKDKRSPLREFLDAEFPNTRELIRQYKARPTPLLVENTGLTNNQLGTLGTAFDLWTRSVLDPEHPDQLAIDFVSLSPALVPQAPAVRQLSAILNGHGSDIDRAAAAWALSWFIQGYRAGLRALLAGPLELIALGHVFSHTELMEMVPPAGIRQIRELDHIAKREFYPHVSAKPLHMGPQFTGSAFCPADADLISHGTLVDIKVRLGLQDKRTGGRRDNIANTDLYQLLGYVLWDFDDEYRIDAVALYSGRFGHFHRWPLDEFMETLAGRRIDLIRARLQTRLMLDD